MTEPVMFFEQVDNYVRLILAGVEPAANTSFEKEALDIARWRAEDLLGVMTGEVA
jgi:hypothetical protein